VAKRALEGLRDGLAATADALMRAVSALARFAGRILGALHALYVRVIAPLLGRVKALIERVYRIVDRVLRPVLLAIRRLQEEIRRMYDAYFRPIVLVIERLRRALYILRLLRVKFAEDLDRKLVELQRRIMEPLYIALERIGYLDRWINVILDSRLLIQEPVWMRSVIDYGDQSDTPRKAGGLMSWTASKAVGPRV